MAFVIGRTFQCDLTTLCLWHYQDKCWIRLSGLLLFCWKKKETVDSLVWSGRFIFRSCSCGKVSCLYLMQYGLFNFKQMIFQNEGVVLGGNGRGRGWRKSFLNRVPLRNVTVSDFRGMIMKSVMVVTIFHTTNKNLWNLCDSFNTLSSH